jgi:hypothetical protein
MRPKASPSISFLYRNPLTLPNHNRTDLAILDGKSRSASLARVLSRVWGICPTDVPREALLRVVNLKGPIVIRLTNSISLRLSPRTTRLAVLGLSSFLAFGGTMLEVATAQSAPPPPGQGQDGGAGDGRQRDGGGRNNGNQDGGGRRGGGFGGGGGMGRMFGGGGFGGGPGGGGMRDLREQLDPDFIRRDVPVFVEQLKLDKMQTTVLETVMKDYETEFTTASTTVQTEITELGQKLFQTFFSQDMRDRMQQQMEQVRDELRQLREEKGGEIDDETRREFFRQRMEKFQQEAQAERKASGADTETKKVLTEMFEKVSAWMTQKEAMRARFVEGLKATLNDDQLTQWDAFDRFLRREKTLPKSRLSGEGTNLIFVLDELKLSDEEIAKLATQLDEYETSLDVALKARNEFLASSTPRLFKAVQEGDSKESTRIMERQFELRTAVRNVNDQYRQAIVNALGEGESARSFEKAALQNGYDRVYRASTAERAFAAALEMTDLDEAVRTAVVDLQSQFLSEMGMKNKEILAVLQKSEPDQQVAESTRFVTMMAAMVNGDMTAMGGPGGGPFGNRGPDAVRDAMDTRREIDDKYLERLKALLTEEQAAQLPQRQGRGGQGGGGGGMTRMLENLPENVRADVMKRFDKNSDGQLDEAERDEAFRAMRDEFGRGGPGGDGAGGRRNRNDGN